MENCTFCGQRIPPGTGKMYVKKDARILYFCSRRCEKNMLKLKRTPRTTGFTLEAKKLKVQTMAAHEHAKQHKEAATHEKAAPKKPAAKVKKAAKPATEAEE